MICGARVKIVYMSGEVPNLACRHYVDQHLDIFGIGRLGKLVDGPCLVGWAGRRRRPHIEVSWATVSHAVMRDKFGSCITALFDLRS